MNTLTTEPRAARTARISSAFFRSFEQEVDGVWVEKWFSPEGRELPSPESE